MRFLHFSTALLATTAFLYGAQIKLNSLSVGSVTYTNVVVLGANVTDLYFTHQSGIGNVKLKYLSPELQKRFNFDPKAAAEADRQRAEDDLRYQKSLADSFAIQTRATDAPTNSSSLSDPLSDKSLLGKPAPALNVEKWVNQEPKLEGKFLLISFWRPDSSACAKWIPELNSIQKEFAEQLAVLGLCAESEATVTNTPTKIEFACAIDSKSRLSAAAGVTSVPTVLLIDPKGTVRYLGHPAAVTSAYLQQLLPKTANGVR